MRFQVRTPATEMTKSFGLLGFWLSRLQLYNVQLVHRRPDIHTTHNCKVDVEEREDAVKYTQDYLGIIIEVIR